MTEPLIADGGGRFHTAATVPTGGAWKTIVLAADHDVFAAVPVAMPPDLEYGQGGVPVAPQRTAPLAPASALLTSETHAGDAWPAVVTYSGLAAITVIWILAIAAALMASIRSATSAPSRPCAAARQPSAAAAR